MTFTELKPVEPIVDRTALRTTDRDLPALMRRVAARELSDLPVTSAYLDLRPTDSGPNPVVRSGRIRLRDGLRDAMHDAQQAKTVHSPEYESLAGDNERLMAALDGLDPSVRGVVAFSCSGDGFFELARLGVPVADDVEIRPMPHLLPLAAIADRARGLVALADTNTLHVFRVRNGGLYELGRDGIDDDPDTYMIPKHAEQPHFDNHIKEHRKGFAREAATRIARELEKGRDELLLLAGPEEATSLLLDELPKAAQEKVIGQVHLELRVTYEELVEAIVPKLEEVHEARVAERTDTAIGEARALDLGATGVLEVGRHLERGGVQELFVDAGLEREHHVDGGPRIDWADELIRQTARTDADVHVVRDHATLNAVGRVAALLRFRI